MNRMTLDAELRGQFDNLDQLTEIRDEAGKLVGMYLPLPLYKKLLYDGVEIPLSSEEIERRRKETTGRALAEHEAHVRQDPDLESLRALEGWRALFPPG